MTETNSGSGVPSEPRALSGQPVPKTDLPEDAKQSPRAASSRPRRRRAHSPPPSKPFPSSVTASNTDSVTSVSSYWSRSSRSSINSGLSDCRYSTSSLESDRTNFWQRWPVILPEVTEGRSPESILNQYNAMLAKGQKGLETGLHEAHAKEFRARIATIVGSQQYSDSMFVLCVTVDGTLPVCRRLDNDMINGTQLLYVLARGRGEADAGNLVLKAERNKRIVHSNDNPQLQGIWIPFERALGYADKLGAIERLYPLFLQDLMPEVNILDNGLKKDGSAIETPENRYVQENVSNADDNTDESPSTSKGSSTFQPVQYPEPMVAALDAMAELTLKEDNPRNEDNQIPMPSIEHILAVEENGERKLEDLPASRPLSTSTSITMQTTSDASTSTNDETIVPSSIELREMLLTRLMDYFFGVLSFTPMRRLQSHQDGSSSSATRPSSTISRGQPSGDPTRANANKRRRASRDENGQDGEDDDLSRCRSKGFGSPKSGPAGTRRLACPYFKNNPRRFQEERSCCGPGWWTVHRVKAPLPQHAMPVHCLRCHQVFSSKLELEEHSRRPDPTEQCKLNPDLPSFLQGRFNSDQEKLLRSRRRTLPKEAGEEEKWVAMYRILFPAEDPALIPSPYYELQDDATSRLGDGEGHATGQDTSELERYESYLRRELPVHVRRELEIRINETLFPLEESLRGQLVDIVRDVQLNLYEAYKASRADNDTSQTHSEELAGPSIDIQEAGVTADDAAGIATSVTGDTDNVIIDGTGGGWSEERTETSMLLAGMELDDELAAFRPAEPYAEQSLGDFDGLLFDIQGLVPGASSDLGGFMANIVGDDSGYAGSSTGCSDAVGPGWAWQNDRCEQR